MYSNPGAWASLLGVDFVRNNKAPGIDYATMHVYVDQWLCVTEGSTLDGQLEFLQCVLSPVLGSAMAVSLTCSLQFSGVDRLMQCPQQLILPSSSMQTCNDECLAACKLHAWLVN